MKGLLAKDFSILNLLVDRAHHLQPYHRRAILAQNDIVNSVLCGRLVNKQRAQPFSGNINGSDNRLILFHIRLCKSKRFQIYIFFRGKNAEQSLI